MKCPSVVSVVVTISSIITLDSHIWPRDSQILWERVLGTLTLTYCGKHLCVLWMRLCCLLSLSLFIHHETRVNHCCPCPFRLYVFLFLFKVMWYLCCYARDICRLHLRYLPPFTLYLSYSLEISIPFTWDIYIRYISIYNIDICSLHLRYLSLHPRYVTWDICDLRYMICPLNLIYLSHAVHIQRTSGMFRLLANLNNLSERTLYIIIRTCLCRNVNKLICWVSLNLVCVWWRRSLLCVWWTCTRLWLTCYHSNLCQWGELHVLQ